MTSLNTGATGGGLRGRGGGAVQRVQGEGPPDTHTRGGSLNLIF